MTSTAEAHIPPPNSSFSLANPWLQIAWDSTSYDALEKCPRLYQYSIIEGFTLDGVENPHFKFGIVFHSATELYSHCRAQGQDHELALLAAVRHTLVETWDSKLSRPWASPIPTKTRDSLLRTLIWYLDKFQDETLETLILSGGKPALELSFRLDTEIQSPYGERYLLCGHIDKVVIWNGEIWIMDKKTTGRELNDHYFREFTPGNQISIYSIAGRIVLNQEIDGLLIDAAQVLVTGSRFRRRPIPRSTEHLEEWMQNFHFRLREAETYAATGFWPQNAKSCGFGNYQCQFRPVCSAEPSMRDEILKSAYVRRTWDPLVPR